MIDAAPVARALRQLSQLDDTVLGRLIDGGPLTRAGLRQALVTGQLAPADFHAALTHAESSDQP